MILLFQQTGIFEPSHKRLQTKPGQFLMENQDQIIEVSFQIFKLFQLVEGDVQCMKTSFDKDLCVERTPGFRYQAKTVPL